MLRHFIFLAALTLSIAVVEGKSPVVVADSTTRLPLPNASVFNRYGKALGMTDKKDVCPTFLRKAIP